MHRCSCLYERRSQQRRGLCRSAFSLSMASLSSSRYSTSSVRSFTSGSLRPRLHAQFGQETSIGSISDTCGDELDHSSWGESFGGYQGYQGDGECFGGYHGDQQYIQRGNHVDWSVGNDTQVGVVRAMGENYFLSADVSGFEPHEVVVVAYHQSVLIHAEKIASDGRVADRLTQKRVLPADMDPLSVSGSLTADGMLIISAGRIPKVFTSDL